MNKSLSRQLLSGFGLSLIILGATTLGINYRAVQVDLEHQGKKRAQSIARSLEFATEGLLEVRNSAILQRMVQNFATLPAITEVAIVSPDGTTIAHSESFNTPPPYASLHPEIRTTLDNAALSGIEANLRATVKEREVLIYVLPFTSRLFKETGKRGMVVVMIDLQDSQRDAWRIFLISTVTMLIGMIVILGFMVLELQKSVLRPINKINQAILANEDQGQVNLPPNLPNNEIGFLADTLINALHKVQEYEYFKQEELRNINAALEDFSASLEQKVAERTHELQLSNHALEQAKDAALAANRAKTAFFANMSHELRTPLHAVLGFTELMLYDKETPPHICEHLNIIQRSGEHLLTLINSALEISKIESGKQTINLSCFNLNELLQTVYEMIEQRAIQKGLNLRFDLVENLYTVVNTDEMKLKQILLNLLTNAVKFTLSGEVVLRVSSAYHDGRNWLKCQVKDTGIGIKPEHLPRVFESFFQSDLGRRADEGTGLGLAITQQFVRLLGGEIDVVSTLGQGTTFSFLIQIQVEPQSEDFSETNSLENHQGTENVPQLPSLYAIHEPMPLRILLAEDNIINQNVTLKMLTRLGYMADVVENGLEVLKALCHKHYDIILMDMQMPIMDGLTAASRIHEDWEEGERPLIIALTANVMAKEQGQYISNGIIAEYLTKPINMTLLQNALRCATTVMQNQEPRDLRKQA
ncbi:MAG: ATP-binding protein [Pseudanabaenaceae cyanobacterium]|jgi:signal transduction histidine kinase/CheY-like chemotaxis protein